MLSSQDSEGSGDLGTRGTAHAGWSDRQVVGDEVIHAGENHPTLLPSHCSTPNILLEAWGSILRTASSQMEGS